MNKDCIICGKTFYARDNSGRDTCDINCYKKKNYLDNKAKEAHRKSKTHVRLLA